jgi:hypothetical protein
VGCECHLRFVIQFILIAAAKECQAAALKRRADIGHAPMPEGTQQIEEHADALAVVELDGGEAAGHLTGVEQHQRYPRFLQIFQDGPFHLRKHAEAGHLLAQQAMHAGLQKLDVVRAVFKHGLVAALDGVGFDGLVDVGKERL